MRHSRLFRIALFSALMLAGPRMWADSTVLVLYKSSENATAEQNIFAYHLQAYAEEAGYTIRYHDIDAAFPPEAVMQEIDAIATAYNGPVMAKAREYIGWISEQLLHRKKVLVIGSFGAYSPDGEIWFDGPILNPFYNLLGLEFTGNWTNDPALIQIESKDSDMVEFETDLTPERLSHYFTFQSLRPDNDIFLSLSRRDMDDSESAVVVKTPAGGMALENYVFAQVDGQPKKLLNLEAFFDACLREPMAPDAVPDKRILALYKRIEDAAPEQTFIARFLAKDLIRLGYWPEYRAVDDGASLDVEMSRYQAVVTWFRTPFMYGAEAYCDWLLTQIREGRKVVIFGNFGAFGSWYEEDDTEVQWMVGNTELNHFLYSFGLEFRGSWTGDTGVLEPQRIDAEMFTSEHPFPQEHFRHYQLWRSVYPDNAVYLQVRRTDQDDSESAFTLRTPFGGFAFEGYIYESDPETWEITFYLDRQRFLRECLEYQTDRTVEPIALVSHDRILPELAGEIEANPPPLVRPAELAPPAPNEVARKILGLYKRRDEEDFSESALCSFAEPVLNHLGMYLDYHAVEDGLPDDRVMQQYRGVLTWFGSSEMPHPEAYVAWLEHQVDQGRKVVILGNFGAWNDLETRIPYRRAHTLFERMGVKLYRTSITNAPKQEIAYLDPEMLNYEYELDLDEASVMEHKLESVDPRNRVLLRLADRHLGDIEPIVLTPSGGLALGDYLLYGTDPAKALRPKIQRLLAGARDIFLPEANYLYYWRLNPYRFFRQAFDLEGVPAPDVTTLNGHRIFYSHIDGDGFKGYSLIDQSNYSAFWVMKEIFHGYTLPITASVISREIEDEPSRFYNRPYMLAREIFALDNIEPASHTYTHPFKWRKGDLQIEPAGSEYDIQRTPVAYVYETEGSMRFIEQNLLPPEKQTEVLLWSGDCHPDAKALSVLYKYDRLNMNAGDPIFDESRNSRTNLSTISNSYGGYRQIHTSGMNDYLYTNGWTQNFDGMKNLVSHFKKTESPQRLSPLNIYYHFYIGDRQLGLDGLHEAYDYCAAQDIAPMFTSQYIQVARDYYATRIFAEGRDTWRVSDNGKLRTVRFDAEPRSVDLAASTGVIGFWRVNQDLYVHLDDGPSHTIRLADTPPEAVYLARGSHYVEHFSAGPEEIAFESYGYGEAEFALANLEAETDYAVTITPNDAPAVSHVLTTDERGTLLVTHPFLTYHGRYRIHIVKRG